MRTIAVVDSLEVLISVSANQAAESIQRLNNQLGALGAGLRRAGLTTNTSFSRITESSQKATKAISKMNAPIKALTNELKRATAQFLTIRGAWKSIENSMDYIETLNYFTAAFGQVASNADLSAFSEMGYESAENYFYSFSERAKEVTAKMSGFNVNVDGTLTATGMPSLGLDPDKLMNYQAMFGQMSSSMGIASETSLKLSQALTEIGADLASVKNMKFEKVWEDMASGLAGMSRTLDKYGANIRNVNLQQKLTELGINANVQALNQNDKALLRGIILLDTTRYAWGDLADTLNQPTNQLRLIEGNIQNLSRTIGNLFLPVVAKVLPYINGFVIALQRLFTWLGKVFKVDLSNLMPKGGGGGSGFDSLVGGADDLEDSVNNATKAVDKLKTHVLGIDELNIVEPDKGGGAESGGTEGIGSGLLDEAFDQAFEEYQMAWDAAFANVESNAQEIADKIQAFFKNLFKPVTTAWNTEGVHVMGSWEKALGSVGRLVKDIGRDFMTMWQQQGTVSIFEDIFHTIEDIGSVVGNLAENFRTAWNTNEVGLHIFENIRDVVGAITGNIRKAADYTVQWSKTLDFYPILSSVQEWTKSLVPVFDALSGMVSDFYTQVLLPLGKWTLEEGLPELLQVFIDFNEKVDWVVLRANLSEFWKHLEPFAETVGEGLIVFIERVSDLVADFINSDTFVNFLDNLGNWMDSVEPEDVADGIEKLAKAFIAFKLAMVGLQVGGEIAKSLTFLLENLTALKAIGKIALVVTVAIEGFELGKELGKLINPEDSGLYDNFKFFGEGGFFSQILPDTSSFESFIEDVKILFDSFVDMATDFENNPVIATLATALNPVLSVYAIVKDNLEDTKDKLDSFKVKFDEFKSLFSDGQFQSAVELWGNDIYSAFVTLGERQEDALNNIKETVKTKWEEFKTWWSTTGIYTWWEEDVSPWFTIEKWSELGQGILDGLMLKWEEIKTWWNESAIGAWWEEDVTPWFTIEKWSELWNQVMEAFSIKWTEIKTWWQNTAIGKWWKENVEPWFTKKKWNDMMSGVIDGFKDTFKNAANAAIEIFNNLIDWINEKLHFDWDSISIAGKEIVPAGSVQLFTIPKIPKFAKGGITLSHTFAEIGELNRPEAILPLSDARAMGMIADSITENSNYGYSGDNGAFDGGQIEEAVRKGVRDAVAEMLAPYLADIAQNTRETADKDMSVTLDGRELIDELDKKNQSLGFDFRTGNSRGRVAF